MAAASAESSLLAIASTAGAYRTTAGGSGSLFTKAVTTFAVVQARVKLSLRAAAAPAPR